jgi:Rdx family
LHTLSTSTSSEPTETLLWDRKTENGFPETKELKNRVRNIIDPGKDMGHIDRRLKKDREEAKNRESGSVVEAITMNATIEPSGQQSKPPEGPQENCEDCK